MIKSIRNSGYKPNWGKSYWINPELAFKLSKENNIGFDQAWCECTKSCFHNYGYRIPLIGGKFRVHQDSMEIYEQLNQ